MITIYTVQDASKTSAALATLDGDIAAGSICARLAPAGALHRVHRIQRRRRQRRSGGCRASLQGSQGQLRIRGQPEPVLAQSLCNAACLPDQLQRGAMFQLRQAGRGALLLSYCSSPFSLFSWLAVSLGALINAASGIKLLQRLHRLATERLQLPQHVCVHQQQHARSHTLSQRQLRIRTHNAPAILQTLRCRAQAPYRHSGSATADGTWAYGEAFMHKDKSEAVSQDHYNSVYYMQGKAGGWEHGLAEGSMRWLAVAHQQHAVQRQQTCSMQWVCSCTPGSMRCRSSKPAACDQATAGAPCRQEHHATKQQQQQCHARRSNIQGSSCNMPHSRGSSMRAGTACKEPAARHEAKAAICVAGAAEPCGAAAARKAAACELNALATAVAAACRFSELESFKEACILTPPTALAAAAAPLALTPTYAHDPQHTPSLLCKQVTTPC